MAEIKDVVPTKETLIELAEKCVRADQQRLQLRFHLINMLALIADYTVLDNVPNRTYDRYEKATQFINDTKEINKNT